MASSGTYLFDPKLAWLIDESFERVGIDPSSIVHRHISSARNSCELMLAEWTAQGSELWKMELTSQALQATIAAYSLAAGTLGVFEGAIRRNGVDTPCTAMSRAEYMTVPSKTQTGLPTRVLFERSPRDTPQITLWQVPENSTDTFVYYRLRRTEDVGSNPAATVDIPYEWREAFCAGLAAKLAVKYAPERLQWLQPLADRSFNIAKGSNREREDTQMTYRSR